MYARNSIPQELRSLYQRHKQEGTRPTRSEISQLLHLLVSQISTSYIIIDAVDECTNIDGTRDALFKDLWNLTPNVRLLCTSRYLGDIAREFQDYPRLELRASCSDIGRYLSERIEGETRLRKHLHDDPTLFTLILDTIVRTSDGMVVANKSFP